MNDRTNATDPEARLRAADPAAGAEPDLTALRAAVRARVEAEGRAGDELGRARSRRWTTWPARVAAAAAAALVVGGGGGYAIGAAGADDPAAPVITLGEPAAPGAPGGAGGDATMSGRADPMAMGGGEEAASDAAYWGGGWRTVFRSSGLSTEPGTGRAWGFDPTSAFSADAVARAAAALGVEGEPREEDGIWAVGSTDGTGPSVTLYPDSTVSLNFYDPSTDPWSCAPVLEEPAATGEDGGAGAMPQPEPCTQRDLGEAPSGDAATDALRDVLERLGVDTSGYEFAAEDWGDSAMSYASAYQVLDGRRTGVAWGGAFTGAGLHSLNGATAPLVDLGEYDVVSPEAAVERLMDPRFAVSGGPMAWVEGAEPRDTAVMSEPSAPSLPGTPSAGAAISWPVAEVTVVEARLGVAMHHQSDGSTILAPTYELVDDDGAIWTVIAVADSHLDLSAGR